MPDRGDTRHDQLRKAGAEPSDDGSDHRRPDTQRRCRPGRSEHELIAPCQQEDEADHDLQDVGRHRSRGYTSGSWGGTDRPIDRATPAPRIATITPSEI